jgi:hypothetical protein
LTSESHKPLHERIEALEGAQTFSELNQAMSLLVEGGEIEALEALIPRLCQTQNQNLLHRIGQAAVAKWKDSVIDRLDMQGASDQEKENALYVCRLEGGEPAQEILREALRDPSANVRYAAASLIAELPQHSTQVLGSLEEAAMSDEDYTVRHAAARALATGKNPDAVRSLETVLVRTHDQKVANLLVQVRERTAHRRSRHRKSVHGKRTRHRRASADHFLARSLPALGRLIGYGVVSALLAVSLIHFTMSLRKVRPHVAETTYVCPACGARQDKLLGPESRCDSCGAFVFADHPYEEGPVAISFTQQETPPDETESESRKALNSERPADNGENPGGDL